MVTYPEDWREVKLGEALVYTQPTNYIENNYVEHGVVPVLTAGKSFILGYSDKTDSAYKNLPAILFDDFTTEVRYLDYPFMVKSSATKFLNLKSDYYDIKYLYYWLDKLKFQIEAHERHWISRFSKFNIVLPPLAEQQAIASALSDFDEHIDNLSDLIEKKKAIREGALDDLVSGRTRVDGFNGEWVEMALEDICVPNGLVRGPFGGSLKKEMFVSKGNKVYEQRNAIYKSVRIGDYYISNGKYNELSRFAVKADDFIVSCSGTIGKIFKIPKQYKRGVINQALLKISIDQTKCNLNYFYKYFEWDKFQDSIIDNTQGGAMKNLVGMDIFRKTVILMPRDITEQKAIAQIISAMDEELKSLKIEKEKMIQIKEGAMDDLLTGRVRLKV